MPSHNHAAKDEQTLLSLLRQDDIRAFEEIYERFWERLYVAAIRLLEDEETSKDIIQEIFIDVWNRRATLQIQNLNAFLYQAVKFQIAKQLRKRPLNPIHLEVIAELKSTQSADTSLHLAELSAQIEQVITALPPRCQEIFRLSRFENLSNKEIAQRLNISLSTVENQIHIALKSLRSNLDNALSFILMCYWLNFERSTELLLTAYC
jgi:RNA polymerase sigma-70 factor (ECF subfamily)